MRAASDEPGGGGHASQSRHRTCDDKAENPTHPTKPDLMACAAQRHVVSGQWNCSLSRAGHRLTGNGGVAFGTAPARNCNDKLQRLRGEQELEVRPGDLAKGSAQRIFRHSPAPRRGELWTILAEGECVFSNVSPARHDGAVAE